MADARAETLAPGSMAGAAARMRVVAPRWPISGLGRALLGLEFALIFLAGPAFVAYGPLRLQIIPTLVVFGGACLAVLLIDKTFDRARLWNYAGARRALPGILRVWAISAAAIAALVIVFTPESLLAFPRRNPGFWLVVMCLYPLFSVYPQEVIYRAFLCHRYEPVFGSGWGMIVASAIAFGWAHIVLHNWIAIAMTTIGGALFARTYLRTRSTLACSIEHALYGDFLFTIGWGRYFYAGANR